MDIYPSAVMLHLASGSLALTCFWVAGAARKGSLIHRRAGQVYLLAMLAVIASGVPLVLGLIDRGQLYTALFLGYLLVLVSNTCIGAWRAVRLKRERAAYFGPLFWILHGLTAATGLAMIAVGWSIGASLFMVFGSIGLFALVGGINAWRRSASTPNWWLREHYGAMIGNGIATHIAFFGIGLRRLLPDVDPGALQSLAWFVPLAVGLLAGFWLDRRYARAAKPTGRALGQAL